MFSVDYIHKSQDALNRNLVNFKNYKGNHSIFRLDTHVP